VVMGDTDRAPYGLGAWGSRSAIVMSGSILMASDRLLIKAREIASHMLEASAEDIVIEDGKFHVVGSAEPALTWAEVATAAWVRTVDLPAGMEPGLEHSGYFEPPELEHLPDGEGMVNAAASWSNGAHVGIVSVRISTGEIEIEDYVVVHDCGTMINPMIIDGQIHGGVAQGIAGAMYEHFQYEEETARPLFASFMEYLAPTVAEMPMLRLDHFESPDPKQPLGVKGCGEGGTIGPPAVITGAVSDALSEFGVDLTETPVTPSKVRDALRAAGGAS
jgi:carbon-monoxide dehydrogenase large subunit